MTVVTLVEAQERLKELAGLAEGGEEVAILTEAGRRVWLRAGAPEIEAEASGLPVLSEKSRKPGAWKGLVTLSDDCFAPLTDEEMILYFGDAFEGPEPDGDPKRADNGSL